MRHRDDSHRLGLFRQAGAVAAAILVLLIALYAMEITGVSRPLAIALTAGFTLILLLAPALKGATARASHFLFADRSVSAGVNSLAILAAGLLPYFIFASVGLSFANPSFPLILGLPLVAGLAISSLFIAGKFRQSGAGDICRFLIDRFDATLPARTAAVIIALAGWWLLLTAISAGNTIIGWFFGLDEYLALAIFCIGIAIASLAGGLASATRLGAVSATLFLVALALPIIYQSIRSGGFPIDQLSLGLTALEQAAVPDQQALSAAVSQVSQAGDWSRWQLALAAIIATLGLAVLPQIIHQFSANTAPQRVAGTSIRAVVLAGLAVLSVMAFAAVTRLGVQETLLGISMDEARFNVPVLYSWSGREPALLQLCGQIPETAEGLMQACGSRHVFGIGDMSINGELAGVAAADLAGHPFAFSALIALAMILSLTAFASTTLIAITSSLTSAFYPMLPGRLASDRVLTIRMLMVLALAMAVLRLTIGSPDVVAMGVQSLGLLAAGLLPALIASIHLPAIAASTAVLSMITGFLVTLAVQALSSVGIDFQPGSGDEIVLEIPGLAIDIPPALSGAWGLLASLAILAVVHLIQKARASEG